MGERRKHQRIYLNATAILSQNNIPQDMFANKLKPIMPTPLVNKPHLVRFRNPLPMKNNTEPIVKSKIVDASLNGLGLRLSCLKKKILSSKGRLEIAIKLPDNQEPIHKSGRIVWYKRSSLFNYRVGVKLE